MAWRKILLILAVVIVWWVGVKLSGVNALVLPNPVVVFKQLGISLASGEIPLFTWNTLKLLFTGYGMGVLGALALTGLAIVWPTGRDLESALTAMLNPLPAIALLPLAILWFGLGNKAIVVVLVHSVLWSTAVNMVTGFTSVPETMVRVGRNWGLKGWRIIAGIYLPAALPSVLAGLKLGWAYAWRTIIAAELVYGATGANGGLGWYIYRARYSLDTASVFAGLITIIAIGLLVDALFQWIEKRTIRKWGMSV